MDQNHPVLDKINKLIDSAGILVEDKICWIKFLSTTGEDFQKSFLLMFSEDPDLLREATQNLKLKIAVLENKTSDETLIKQQTDMLLKAWKIDQGKN